MAVRHPVDPFVVTDGEAFSSGPPGPTFKILRCNRKKSTNIRGTRVIFGLTGNGVTLSAKYKNSKSEFIPIVVGEDIHLSAKTWNSVLLHGNQYSAFSLRKESQIGEEIMSLRFTRLEDDVVHPRTLECFFFQTDGLFPRRLESAEPEMLGAGKWSLYLKSDHAISSIRNCRLDDEMHRHYCYVRKMSRNLLEIEARDCLPDLCLFAIGISSWLARK
jgi:hypothetical protein